MKLYTLLSRLALCVALLGTASYIVSMVRESSVSDFIDDSGLDYNDSDSDDSGSDYSSSSDTEYSSSPTSKYSVPQASVKPEELVQTPFDALTLDQKASVLASLEKSTKLLARKLYVDIAKSVSFDDIARLISEFSFEEAAALNAVGNPTDENIGKVKNALVRAFLNVTKENSEE